MSNARNLARLIVDSGGDVDVSSLGNVPPSNDASALTTGTLPIARIAANAITADKLGVGKYIKQMKHARLDSQVTTSASGNVAALAFYFDSPVTVGNQILVMASGSIVAGPATNNWGCGADIFVGSVCATSQQNSTGTSPYFYQGAIDNNGDYGWGDNFGISGIVTATETNPQIALMINRQSNWTWVGLGYTDSGYGKTASNLLAIEFGV